MPGPHGSKPEPPDRRPYRRMSEPGEEITFETADPTGRRWRKVWRQVGWLGQSGAFYALGESATAHEPGSVAPLYFPAHADEIGPDPALTGAYRERARLVAHLASLFPSVLQYSDPDDPEWPVTVSADRAQFAEILRRAADEIAPRPRIHVHPDPPHIAAQIRDLRRGR